jgi:hypothetical protein
LARMSVHLSDCDSAVESSGKAWIRTWMRFLSLIVRPPAIHLVAVLQRAGVVATDCDLIPATVVGVASFTRFVGAGRNVRMHIVRVVPSAALGRVGGHINLRLIVEAPTINRPIKHCVGCRCVCTQRARVLVPRRDVLVAHSGGNIRSVCLPFVVAPPALHAATDEFNPARVVEPRRDVGEGTTQRIRLLLPVKTPTHYR